MNSPEDSRLRTHFANLREEDRSAAPPFARTAAAAAALSRCSSSLRIALAAIPVLAIAVMLAVRTFSPLAAQQPPEDPLRDVLFPPEAVMQHQQAVGLTDEQKNNLKGEVRQAQLKFTELQWTLQDEMERLVSLLKQSKVDEKQTASQLDKVLGAEREIKRAQLMLLVRIKNNLTPAQQTQLRELVEKSKVR